MEACQEQYLAQDISPNLPRQHDNHIVCQQVRRDSLGDTHDTSERDVLNAVEHIIFLVLLVGG